MCLASLASLLPSVTAGQRRRGHLEASLAFRLVSVIKPSVGGVTESERSSKALGTDRPVALCGLVHPGGLEVRVGVIGHHSPAWRGRHWVGRMLRNLARGDRLPLPQTAEIPPDMPVGENPV